jgi:hypothetical protein
MGPTELDEIKKKGCPIIYLFHPPIFIRFASLESKKKFYFVWWEAPFGGRPGVQARAPWVPLNPALWNN